MHLKNKTNTILVDAKPEYVFEGSTLIGDLLKNEHVEFAWVLGQEMDSFLGNTSTYTSYFIHIHVNFFIGMIYIHIDRTRLFLGRFLLKKKKRFSLKVISDHKIFFVMVGDI